MTSRFTVAHVSIDWTTEIAGGEWPVQIENEHQGKVTQISHFNPQPPTQVPFS